MTDGKLNNACAVALGNFDGLHIGHKKVLESALEFSEKYNLEPNVMLFDIHPRELIFGEKIPKLLTDTETEKLLAEMGFSVYRVGFADIKDYTSEVFFNRILIGELNAKALCCGFNYSFGKYGAGNEETLRILCEKNNVKCSVIQPVSVDGVTVSSTAVRSFLLNGEVRKAAEMLGRNYAVSGEVVHGDARGRTLGFPTANQIIDESLVVPKYGVYETSVSIDGQKYKGVTNIGIRPTYRSQRALAETNIIDFSGSLYGRNVSVELLRYIRPETRFNSAEELKSQLLKDTAEVTGNV